MESKQIVGVLKRAKQAMYVNDFSMAMNELQPLLSGNALNQEALYMAVVSTRYLGDLEQAERLLSKLLETSPEFGRAHQEAGYLAIAKQKPDHALMSFKKACRYNPALFASWEKQAELLQAKGKFEEANSALAQSNRIKQLPKELFSATNLLAEGKLLKAEDVCRQFLLKNPKHVEGMRLLADIGTKLGILEDADFLLEKAIEFEPKNIQLRLDYIQVLRKRQKFEEALREAKHLYEREPDSPIFQSHYAIEKMQTGDYAGAIDLLDKVLVAIPNDPASLTSKGHALKTWGKQQEAIKAYQAACVSRPEQGDAWYALANLKTYTFSDAQIQTMLQMEGQPHISFSDKIHFCFALGKAFEDNNNIEKSFHYYEKGNALKKAQSRYTSEGMEAELAAQKTVCTPKLFERLSGSGYSLPDPIFIVGLPRAGSTLIEQILASHSQVDGTLELPNVLSLTQRLRGRNRSDGGSYPDCLQEITSSQYQKMGQEYIDTTRIHRQGAAFFTDKMPNNFRHIGLIHLMLPNAKIIDARRDPMSCCFSGFKQLFAEGQEFTYGLDEIGRYYKAYVDLMDHWNAVLPGKILHVQHEEVVADLEGQVRRILDYCDLPFEDGCLQFYKTERAVRTASSEQVRSPISKKGLDVWKKFDQYLDPLKLALGPCLVP